MLKRLVLALVLAVSAATSIGIAADSKFVVPQQSITGADKPIPLGEEAVLSISPIADPKPASLLSSSEHWKLFEVGPDGIPVERQFRVSIDPDTGMRQLYFAVGLKDRKVFAAAVVTHLYVVTDASGKVTEAATRTVIYTSVLTIGNGGVVPVPPGPQPGPGPNPPAPTPTVVDGEYGLTKFVFDAVSANVTAGDRVTLSKAVAKAFRGVVAQIQAGTIKFPADALAAAKKAGSGAVAGTGLDPAKTGWTKANSLLQEQFAGLYDKGTIFTVADFGAAIAAIADGLDAVR